MKAFKTMGYWFTWLFWYGIACVPAALFGSTVAAAFYGFHTVHKPHIGSYFQGMYLWEIISRIVSAVPGFSWVGLCQVRDYQKKQAKLCKMETADVHDTSVWPPPPHK